MANDYKLIFWQKDLFIDFDMWQKVADGLVGALKKKDVDMYYINQAEHFKATLGLVGGANLSDYAETVLKEVAQIDGWYNAEATPEDVKEICRQFYQTVKALSPSNKLDNLLDVIKNLRDDLRDAESTLQSIEDEIDGIKDDLDDARQETKEFIDAYKAAFDDQKQDDNSQKD